MAEVTKYLTPVFRLSFPNLFEAKAMDAQSKPKFGCAAVWSPAGFSEGDKAKWKAIGKALNDLSLSVFKKPWKDLPPNIKRGLRKGEEKGDMEGYGPGTMFANLTTKIRPGVVSSAKGPDGKPLPIGPEEGNADEIYPGCYCRATVTVYSYNNKGKGVALGLMNIQKVKDGDRLDSRSDASEDFQEGVDEQWLDDEQNEEAVELDDEIPF
jgi:hypothetical protein